MIISSTICEARGSLQPQDVKQHVIKIALSHILLISGIHLMKIYIHQRYELFEKLRKFDTIIDLYVLIFGNSTLNSDQIEEIFLFVQECIQDSRIPPPPPDCLNSNASIKTM